MTHAVHSWPAATPHVVAESCGTIALLDRTHHLTVVVTLSGHKAVGNKHSNMCSLTLLQAPLNHIMCVQCHVAYLHTTQQQQCQMGSMQHLYKRSLVTQETTQYNDTTNEMLQSLLLLQRFELSWIHVGTKQSVPYREIRL